MATCTYAVKPGSHKKKRNKNAEALTCDVGSRPKSKQLVSAQQHGKSQHESLESKLSFFGLGVLVGMPVKQKDALYC